MKVDFRKFYGKEFHWRNYNCWDFTREVWKDAGGVDIGSRQPREWTSAGFREAFAEQEHDVSGRIVQRLDQPENPCLVMLTRPGVLSHVGVYVRGKLFHLHPFKGVVLEPLEIVAMGFDEVRFYK